MFPSWRYDTHGWFECVWCRAVTNAKKVSYPDPQPGGPVGHIEAEDRNAHGEDCPLASLVAKLDAYARQRVREALEEAEKIVEAQRQKILANPRDPSWTEHLAEVGIAIAARRGGTT